MIMRIIGNLIINIFRGHNRLTRQAGMNLKAQFHILLVLVWRVKTVTTVSDDDMTCSESTDLTAGMLNLAAVIRKCIVDSGHTFRCKNLQARSYDAQHGYLGAYDPLSRS